MAAKTINPIKKGLFDAIVDAKAALNLKWIGKDISPQSIIEAMRAEPKDFPAVLVNYTGRIPTKLGDAMITAPTFCLFVAHRDMSGAYVSGEKVIDLIEDLVELIDNRRFANEQKSPFQFAGDELVIQDTTFVMYQLLFRTETAHQRRY